MRHAKSAWPIGVRDELRPLNNRGKRNAPQAGAWIVEQIGAVDRVLVSTAKRTQMTWQLAHEQGGIVGRTVIEEPRLYAASWWELLDVIREQPESARTVMLVGHNPGTEDLADELAASGDPEGLTELGTKFPTAGVALLSSESDWSKWGAGCATLVALFTPRG